LAQVRGARGLLERAGVVLAKARAVFARGWARSADAAPARLG
jgi:hypothetical protein